MIVDPLVGSAAESVGLTSVAVGVGLGLLVLPQPGVSVLCVQTACAGADSPKPITAEVATTLSAVTRDRRLPEILVMERFPDSPISSRAPPRFWERSMNHVKPLVKRLRNGGGWTIAFECFPPQNAAPFWPVAA
ncbi:hypothetical protein [Streptomyces sp. NPDC003015]